MRCQMSVESATCELVLEHSKSEISARPTAMGPLRCAGLIWIVEEGEFFGLLGPNGAGKSTTIGIITSLVNKTGGTVRCFGVDLDRDPGAGQTPDRAGAAGIQFQPV